ncbi:MAG: preQ(1) synthase [Planctomycetota bacterium]
MDEFRYLGKPASQPTDTLDLIEWKGEPILVRLDCSEFSSMCPVTNQPDYGTLIIEYVPDRSLAETKSVKLYLWRYRDQQGFNEVLVDTIASDLYKQIKPLWLRVIGKFNPRGGISVTATAERGDKEYRPS